MEQKDKSNNISKLIEEKWYSEAAEIFKATPLLDYETNNPIFSLDSFEFSSTQNKNPIFLRVLLNYIALINIILDIVMEPKKFHTILSYFQAKFTYEEKENGFIKIILMAKTTIEVYNLIFQEGEKAFEKISPEIKQSIDKDFDKKNEESFGYAFQELGRVFINDYIIGRDKGNELPNILFYVNSTEKMENLIGTLFAIPSDKKLNLKEDDIYPGITEFDNVLLLNDDMIINENNPYFRYIKTVHGSNAVYEKLELKKNEIYLVELKHSYTMNEKIAGIQKSGKTYIELYKRDVYNNEKPIVDINNYKILYFYNYFENLGYKTFSRFNIDLSIWRLLYLNPSCQIVPVTKLTSRVSKLEKEVKSLEQKVKDNYEDLKLRLDNIESQQPKNWFANNTFKDPNNIETKKVGEITINKDLKYQIEEQFQELSKKVSKLNDLKKYNKLFEGYATEIKNFSEPEEKLTIDPKDNRWKITLEGNIPDDKTCFELMIPCIGKSKSSKNYTKIQEYFKGKIDKNDEMSEIYQYIYYCFYGERTTNDKKPPEYFYSGEKKILDLLINIVKYTFYCDRKRKEKEYYLLAIFQELLKTNDEEIRENILDLKNKSKSLYQLVLMSIALINSSFGSYKKGFFSSPNKMFI